MQLASGATNTGKVLEFLNDYIFSEEFGSRPTAPKVVVIMTDGHDKDQSVSELLCDLKEFFLFWKFNEDFLKNF